MDIPEPTAEEKARLIPKSPESTKQSRLNYIRRCRELGFTDNAIAEKLGLYPANVQEFMKHRGEMRSIYNWKKKQNAE